MPRSITPCVGGCEHHYGASALVRTPKGLICERCFNDLYIVCYECDAYLCIDSHGECDELVTSPDSVQRCRACAERLFSRCCSCGRMTHRVMGTVCMPPDDGDNREFCQQCWNDTWFECVACGGVSYREDCHTDGNQRSICFECFDTQYTTCSACSCAILHGEHRGWEGDPYCENCYGYADAWKVQPWSGHATSFDKVGSKRRFGVELETCECDNWRSLHGKTEWGCVYECSTSGREFISPILQGDAGFAEIRGMCSTADELGWTINPACGLHIHLDVSNESTEECLRIAYAYRRTYTLWKSLVAQHRRDNSMCGSPQYSCADIRAFEHIEDFAELRDRFEFVNWRSYIKQGSFEIRVYQGTLNAREICAWIAIHTRFIDAVKDMSFDEIDGKIGAQVRTNWRGLCEVIDDTDLLDYWRRKASNMGAELPVSWEEEAALEAALLRTDSVMVNRPADLSAYDLTPEPLDGEFVGVETEAETETPAPSGSGGGRAFESANYQSTVSDGLYQRFVRRFSHLPSYPEPPPRVCRVVENFVACPCPECAAACRDTGVVVATDNTGCHTYSIIDRQHVVSGRVNLADFNDDQIYYDPVSRTYTVEHRLVDGE